MAEKIAAESHALLKERFPYPIFLYEAEKVGITATGETGEDVPNELGPKGALPHGVPQSCLTLYRQYRENPEAFLLENQTDGPVVEDPDEELYADEDAEADDLQSESVEDE